MNSRGMIGLVILNLGFQLGIITQPLFTILAIMDLVTTLIAPPLFLKFLGESALVDLRRENEMRGTSINSDTDLAGGILIESVQNDSRELAGATI